MYFLIVLELHVDTDLYLFFTQATLILPFLCCWAFFTPFWICSACGRSREWKCLKGVFELFRISACVHL